MTKRKRSKATKNPPSFRSHVKQIIQQSKAGTYVTPSYLTKTKKERTERQKQADAERSLKMSMIRTYRDMIEFQTGEKLSRKGWSYKALAQKWKEVAPPIDTGYDDYSFGFEEETPTEPPKWYEETNDIYARQYRKMIAEREEWEKKYGKLGWDESDIYDDPLLVNLREREERAKEERERKKREREYETDAIKRNMYITDNVTGEIIVYTEEIQSLFNMLTERIGEEGKSPATFMTQTNAVSLIKDRLQLRLDMIQSQEEMDDYGTYISDVYGQLTHYIEDVLRESNAEAIVEIANEALHVIMHFSQDDAQEYGDMHMESYQEEFEE